MSKYLRSMNIALDRSTEAIQHHLVLTRPLTRTIDVIARAISGTAEDAAISIVGPYGTGKSTSILCAIDYLTGLLPSKIMRGLNKRGIKPVSNPLNVDQIIPIVGDRSSLKKTISLHLKNIINAHGDLVECIDRYLEEDSSHRLVLIVDELGKFLEYSLDHPQDGDVFLLQQLAELANRSGGRFILITVRHQALQAYMKRLHRQQLDEWRKIQGRFLEVVHLSTLEETLPILYEGITDLKLKEFPIGERLHARIRDLVHLDDTIKNGILMKCYPVHPLTAIILISVFKKVAQNERSLFSFLVTNERFGLRYFLSRSKEGTTYSLAYLFDYLNNNFYNFIVESDLSSAWSKVNNSLAFLKTSDVNDRFLSRAERVVKTIGVLECFGEAVSLPTTKEAIYCALSTDLIADKPSVPASFLKDLEEQSILNYRRLTRTFHLWRGSDINIDKLIEGEVDRIRTGFEFPRFFKDRYHSYPISARKYYIETGTFRYANWQFCSLDDAGLPESGDGDGTILCLVLPRTSLKKAAELFSVRTLEGNTILVGLKLNLKDRENILRFAAIDHLLQHHQPLVKDEVARQELWKQREFYRDILDRLFGQESYAHHWLYHLRNNKFVPIRREDIGRLLSDAFEKFYHATPIIRNELINSERPSASANTGLNSALYCLLESPHKENLGIEGTGPDYSIYLNVIKEPGIHAYNKKGTWGLFDPPKNDQHRLSRTWSELTRLLRSTQKTRKKISIKELEDKLRQPPYGLKTGLIKVLVFASICRHYPNLSLYEKGTFTPQIFKDTMDRMLKRPENFTLRFVETSGVHQILFKEVYQLLSSDERAYVSLMDAVKPLILFVNRLPDYTKKTKSLTSQSRAMVDVLLHTSEPEVLLYEHLPAVFKMPSFVSKPTNEDLKSFVSLIAKSHREILNALDRMIDECATQFQKIWGSPSNDLPNLRSFLKRRFSKSVCKFITDDKMSVIARRIHDDGIENDSDWFRSLISMLVDKPVDKWLDRDIQHYVAELRLRAMQLEELERFAESAGDEVYITNPEPEVLEQEIMQMLNDSHWSSEEKILALMRVYNKLMREHKFEN